MTDRAHPPAAPDDPLRDDHLDALWDATRSDGPPPGIDASLLAAARRAVGAGPRREDARVPEATRPERWWTPLAAAAAIGAIALGLLQLVPDERTERAVVSDMPAPAERKALAPGPAGRSKAEPAVPQAPATPASGEPAPATSAATAPSRAASSHAAAKPASPPAAPSAPVMPAPSPQPQAAAVAATPPAAAPEAKREARGARKDAPVPFPLQAAPQRETMPAPATDAGNAMMRAPAVRRGEAVIEQRDAAPATTDKLSAPGEPPAAAPAPPPAPAVAPVPAAPPASAGAVGGAMPLAKTMKKQESDDAAKPDMRTPEERIALIRRLRDERKFDEAAKELAAFRAAYPDAERMLPPDLRDWRPPPRYRQ